MTDQVKYATLVHSTLDRRNTVDAVLASYVTGAATGAIPTATFFANFNGLHGLLMGLRNSSLQTGKDKNTGGPVYWMQVGDYKLMVKCHQYMPNFVDGKPRANDDDLHKFKWNGQEYAIAGMAECSIVNGKTHLFWNSAQIGMSIANWGKFLFEAAIVSVMWTMLKNAGKRLINGFIDIALGPMAGDANVLAEAASEGLLVEEEISTMTTAACFVGLAVIAIGVTLALVEHPTFQVMKIYNLTTADVRWDLKYLQHGTEVNSEPSDDGINPTFLLRGGMPPVPPDDDIIPDSNDLIYSEGTFQFKNGEGFRGIYYVMTLVIDGESTPFSFLFDIPFNGDNSLYASAEALADKKAAEKYYNAHASQEKKLLYAASGSKYSLSLTYDYLSGKHPMPPDNKEKYYYQSLVVLRPV